MASCFVTRRLPGPALERLATVHPDLEVWEKRLPPSRDALLERAPQIEGLLCMLSDPVDAALIAAAPHLRAISTYAVGTDNIDLAAAAACGIPVGHTPDVLTEATADLAFALLLAAARNLPAAEAAVHAGDWPTWEPATHLGYDVHGATLGIVGGGRIGQAVARRARGFDMTVLTATRTPRADSTPLDELLKRSDFLSLHAPLTPQTHHLIDARALARMKPTAIIVNTARGPIVDTDALTAALHGGTIAGAALDVTDPEPLPPTHALLQAPTLLVVPHIGSATHATREQMAELAVDNLLAGLAGQPLPHEAKAP
jgi:glyoxylate reductase